MYSDEERSEALTVAAEVGFAEAGRRLGIPSATLRSWVHRAEKVATGMGVEVSPAGVVLSWPERRERVVPKLGELAEEALGACHGALRAGKARDAQAFATTAAILIDKTQLLTGGASRRTESVSVSIDARVRRSPEEVRAEVERMRRELGYADAIEGEVVGDG